MAIPKFMLPPNPLVSRSNIRVYIPLDSMDAFRQLERLVIQITNTDIPLTKRFEFQRGTKHTNSKLLVLISDDEDPQDEQPIIRLAGNPRFIDESSKRIEFVLTDTPDGQYQLSGELHLPSFKIDLPIETIEIGEQRQAFMMAGPDPGDVVDALREPTQVEFSTPLNMTVNDTVNVSVNEPVHVSMTQPDRFATGDQSLWSYIRNGTLDFRAYQRFIDAVMVENSPRTNRIRQSQLRSPIFRTDAYSFLKQATDFFMDRYFYRYSSLDTNDPIDNTNLRQFPNPVEQQQRLDADFHRTLQQQLPDPTGQLAPYFEQILGKLPGMEQLVNGDPFGGAGVYSPLVVPNLTLLELIWSYWHEEGGLVQTMNAISLRFQNRVSGVNPDPLAGLNIDPLRPLNNLIWGYIQDERFRLSLAQRNYEYQYEYGISLIGRAVPNGPVAESRSQFIPAFHNLLKAAVDFYQQANYTTVIPDGFPILNNLREVHLLLAEGAHNSFRDLPYTARAEMLTQQWILARPEMREFLGGRIMVPYAEPWMDRVDTMKSLQGWDPANITHFHDLGYFGEQILLSVRYGAWNGTGTGALNGANWAHYWREEIQRYIHAYKAVTGVDLAADVTDARIALPTNIERYEQPATLINRRLGALPTGQSLLSPGQTPVGMNLLSRRRMLRGS